MIAQRLLATVFAATLTSAPVTAQESDAKPTFAVKGAGLARCSDFLTAVENRDPQRFLFGGWLQGYISAINEAEDSMYDLVPWQSFATLGSLMVQICEQSPDTRYRNAAVQLLRTFRAGKLDQYSEPVSISGGERDIRLPAAVLERAQARLAALGHYAGDADGLWGPQSEQAFKAFQESRGIPVSGLPTQQTLFVLLTQGAAGAAGSDSGSNGADTP